LRKNTRTVTAFDWAIKIPVTVFSSVKGRPRPYQAGEQGVNLFRQILIDEARRPASLSGMVIAKNDVKRELVAPALVPAW